VIFDDLNFDFVPYTPIGAYGQSKTADALLAVGITQRWADDGIRSNTLHPGAIATGLQKYTGRLKTPPDRRKTPEQGASTSVLLAASPLLDGISGLYFEDCNGAQQVTKRPRDFTGGYAGYALDLENAERLWNLSMKLISSRVSSVQTAMRNCTRDEGRSFEAGSQVLASNRCKLLSSKSDGGERCSQRRENIPAGEVERGERKRTADELSKAD